MSHDGDSQAKSLRRHLSAVSGSSRAIPSDQDFHYYNNFVEFRNPIRQIAAASQSGLDSIAVSPLLSSPPYPPDPDDAYDHVVDANDSFLERIDAAMSDAPSNSSRSSIPDPAETEAMEMDGFEVVTGKKNRKKKNSLEAAAVGSSANAAGVRMATRDAAEEKKPKISFHIPTIPRSQKQFGFTVDNSNQPFRHAWLEGFDDGRVIHPLEKYSFTDFVDEDVLHIEPVKSPSVESTPFKLVEDFKDLKELAAKLSRVTEFAVDLEHNKYRSFQGLTCLIQISTRTEDFVIDALKLRVLIGPHLRDVFKDPTKRKVMHGAEQDIFWLQRDFGIYVCNLFDTGQASRVLQFERHGLEFLLRHYCGVTANKEYQTADWRLRPIPPEMLRYAREDTHYLLHIYDLMRKELFLMSKDSESPNASLLEVYKHSYDICIKLYQKELRAEDSYLYIYGLPTAGLNAQQLAIVSGLFDWRDVVARAEDESTGYILPNRALIEIAKQMPESLSQLRRLVRSKHPHVEQNLATVFSIIKNSKLNAASFETAVQNLKDGLVGKVPQDDLMANEEPEAGKAEIASHSCQNVDGNIPSPLKENAAVLDQRKDRTSPGYFPPLPEVTGATSVQVQKKPSRGLGALLGKNKTSKKSLDPCKQDKKLDEIRASIQFPLQSFSEQPKPVVEEAVQVPISASSISDSKLDDVMMFPQEEDSEIEESINGDSESISPSELSSRFQKCFEERNRIKKSIQDKDNSNSGVSVFDYEVGRKEVVFGKGNNNNNDKSSDSRCNRKKKDGNNNNINNNDDDNDEAYEFSQGRRRKAFPASGNRSASFR